MCQKWELYTKPVTLCIYIFCFSANTRVIKQSSLQKFQEEMGAVQKDPYRVVMKRSKLPMSLLHDRVKAHVSIKGINHFLLYFVLCCLYDGPLLARGHVYCLLPYIKNVLSILTF